MKKYIYWILASLFIGYVYGNFGNTDLSMDYLSRGGEELDYHGRGDSFHDYRSRGGDSSYDYRGRDSDNSYEYRGRGGSDRDTGGTSYDYRGRSASTGRFVHRSGRR